jgi:hypothetical protein
MGTPCNRRAGLRGGRAGGAGSSPPATQPMPTDPAERVAAARARASDPNGANHRAKPTFTRADVGKRVVSRRQHVSVNGVVRAVEWRSARHDESCDGVIQSVQEWPKGLVVLTDGRRFQQPCLVTTEHDDETPAAVNNLRARILERGF